MMRNKIGKYREEKEEFVSKRRLDRGRRRYFLFFFFFLISSNKYWKIGWISFPCPVRFISLAIDFETKKYLGFSTLSSYRGILSNASSRMRL